MEAHANKEEESHEVYLRHQKAHLQEVRWKTGRGRATGATALPTSTEHLQRLSRLPRFSCLLRSPCSIPCCQPEKTVPPPQSRSFPSAHW